MIHRLALVPFVLTALAVASASLHATTYTLEPNHTQGVVRWDHLGFSNPTAQFSHVEGTLEFDPANVAASSVRVTIPIANLGTGVSDLDDDFHAKEFFDIANFPTAAFKSTKVEKGAMAGQLKVSGDLTLRGVTKPVVLDATLNKIGINPRNHLPSIGFAATTSLKRSDFGLGRFVPQVGDAIEIQITAEGAEAKGYAELQKKETEEEAREAKAAAAKAATATSPPPGAPAKN